MNKRITSLACSAITAALCSAITITSAQAAFYTIEQMDASLSPVAKHSYAQQANTQGESVLSGTYLYNIPVQFDYFTEIEFLSIYQFSYYRASSYQHLTPIDDDGYSDLVNGTPKANELAWAVLWLSTQAANPLYQKVNGTLALYNSAGSTEVLTVFDQRFSDVIEGNTDDSYTGSTFDILKGITDSSFTFGSASAPYLPLAPWPVESIDPALPDGELTYWYRDFSKRAFYSSNFGEAQAIIPPSESIEGVTAYGGESGLLGAAPSDDFDGHYAVGFMSTAMNETVADKITAKCGPLLDDDGNLIEDDEGNPTYSYDYPVEICYQNYRDSGDGNYDIRGFISNITTDGADTVELPLLITPHVDDTRSFSAYATAVNSSGVAVGYSHGWVRENVNVAVNGERALNYAVVYKKNSEEEWVSTSVADNHSTDFDSRAYDINDKGIAVGHVTRSINGKYRTKFYYVDTNNVDDMEPVFPVDFFNSSSSTARAINNHGLIVGEGEIETHSDSTSNPRRTAAFIYDLNTKTITDLNTLILSDIIDEDTCTLAYNVIQARDINDDGTISASAIKKVVLRDAKGEAIIGSNGYPLTEDVVVAVKLTETEESPKLCKPVDKKVKRQGASFSLGSLFFIFALAGFSLRQRRFNH